MLAVLNLFILQGILGAFDNLWHHEFTEKLPSRPTAWKELALHSARGFLYSIIFLSLGWLQLHGLLAAILIGILIIEVGITLWDFVEEDMTRKLPATERVLHTVLALNYGAVLGLLIPILWTWSANPTAITPAYYGWQSWVMTLYGVGIIGFAIRDGIASVSLHKRLAPEWHRAPFVGKVTPSGKTVLVTGATGFIGKKVIRALILRGDEIIIHSRDRAKADYAFGPNGTIVTDLDEIPSTTKITSIVSLAGEPIIGLPWSVKRRASILNSRTESIDNLLKLVRRLDEKPDSFVQASAVGFYGDQAERLLDETATPCERRFTCVSCLKSEARAGVAQVHDLRTVLLRFAMVLGNEGGGFPALALPIKLGLGAILGRGDQWMPWIHIDDAVGLVLTAIDNQKMVGPVNAVAPDLVTHAHLTKTIAKVLNRPIFFRVPAFVLRTMIGEMSDIFLASAKIEPKAAHAAKYKFKHPKLEGAMRNLLSKEPKPARKIKQATISP